MKDVELYQIDIPEVWDSDRKVLVRGLEWKVTLRLRVERSYERNSA